MEQLTDIYIALLDEGIDTYGPVKATHKHKDIYIITGHNLDPEDEHWQFVTGDAVRCRTHTFSGGQTGLLAYEKE